MPPDNEVFMISHKSVDKCPAGSGGIRLTPAGNKGQQGENSISSSDMASAESSYRESCKHA